MILSLALISFVFLLVITLVSQVRQDLAYSDARQNHILAKAHARMGMMIAIGEIQKHLGPDMRISTTADIYDERVQSLEDNIQNQNSPLSVDLYENNQLNIVPEGQRFWTGVWKTRAGDAEENSLAYRPLPYNRDGVAGLPKSWDTDTGYDRHPAIEVAWLVSGNEGWQRKLAVTGGGTLVNEFIEVPDGVVADDDGSRVLNNPKGLIYGKKKNEWADHKSVVFGHLGKYSHPLKELPSPDENDSYAWLFKASDFQQGGQLYYPLLESIKAPKTEVLSSSDKSSGKYAYWVGDEGVKAKLNISDSIPLDQNTRLTVASSPQVLELNRTTTENLLSRDSAEQLLDINLEGFQNILTTNSFGILTDVRAGGLKRDLSLAFSDSESEAFDTRWKKDFRDNFIFRDRVHCLKSFPIYDFQSKNIFGTDGLKRNHWLDQVAGSDRGPLIDDKDVLLAGPRWSVLQDFHNLHQVYNDKEILEVSSPSQFPRVVGDNTLIFDRRGIKGNQGMTISQSTPFFNVFGGPIRSARPEPQNHPIIPVITKVSVSVFPAISSSKKLALAINPTISLWNPYDKPMKLDGLFVEIPFRQGEFWASHFNLKEYDLYRKWWISLYNSVPDFPTQPRSSSKSKNAKFKSVDSPWGLFPRSVEKEKTSGFGVSGSTTFKQPGIIEKFKGGYEEDATEGILNFFKEGNGVVSLEHENIRENVTYNGDFHFFSFHDDYKVKIELPRIFLSLGEEVLGPGEVGLFSVEDLQVDNISNLNDSTPMIVLRKGDTEDFFLLESDFTYNNPQYSNDYFITHHVDFSGVNGFSKKTAEQIRKIGEEFSYTSLGTDFDKYDGLTLYKGDASQASNFDPNKADILIRFTMYGGSDETYSKKFHTTEKYFHENYSNAFDSADEKLPGVGWEWGIIMPGDKENEYITLNHFNVRALVHSQQEGSGHWFNAYTDLRSDKFQNSTIDDKLNFAYDAPPSEETFRRTDEEGNVLVFDLSDPVDLLVAGLNKNNLPKYMNTPPNTIEFPWIYDFGSWDVSTYDINKERSFNEYSYLRDPDSRAAILGLQPTGINPTGAIEADNENIWLVNPLVPRAINAQNRIGFFTNSTKQELLENRNEIDASWGLSSNQAILFEVPVSAPLSILQYRHASLNNYLHGPSYALGNSYATTQVARHRSWGRMSGIESKVIKDDPDVPEAETWTSSVRNPKDMWDLQQEVKKMIQDEFPERWADLYWHSRSFIEREWGGIDLDDTDSQFAPWRGQGGAQHNHQNTTLDHSFYLNRGLLGGYFLTGCKTINDHIDKDTGLIRVGSLYRPFLWGSESIQSFNEEEYDYARGNHRLVGYIRKNDDSNKSWTTTSYSLNSSEISFSQQKDKAFRYQTIAADLLVDGAFNINSTAVDAWAAQFRSLRGEVVPNASVGAEETPVVRFLAESASSNGWNELRKLSDDEILELSRAMVEQVKLRGPFLSFADFVNRRLAPSPMDKTKAAGTRPVFLQKDIIEWENYPEDRNSITGLRGAVQAAVAKAGLNSASWASTNSMIPQWPERRWIPHPSPSSNNFGKLAGSKFGYHATSQNGLLFGVGSGVGSPGTFGSGKTYNGTSMGVYQVLDSDKFGTAKLFNSSVDFKTTNFGEAPENLLAVEHVATGANKPGWIMQSDLLSPLVPVTSARSDTFTIRVMGENSGGSKARAWIELVVQRTPDYVKSDLDAPHHRPHEPFKDLNLNGYWDNSGKFGEHWLDLNRNGEITDYPDLPGVGEGGRGKDFRDGMLSDLKLNFDPQEESTTSQIPISLMGINQRFGRKFIIVHFRWLREQDV